VSVLLQWESGITLRTLLQVVRESNAKGRLFRATHLMINLVRCSAISFRYPGQS